MSEIFMQGKDAQLGLGDKKFTKDLRATHAVSHSYSFSIRENSTALLEELSRRESITLQVSLRALLSVLLQKYLGQDLVSIGVMLSEYPGIFMIEANLSGDPGFRELLHRSCNPSSLPNALRRLPERDPNLRFEIRFMVPDVLIQPFMQTGCGETHSAFNKSGLFLSFTLKEKKLHCVLDYETHLYEEWAIAQVADHFQNLLEEVLADPSAQISHLKMMRGEEWHQIVHEWNETYQGYEEKCVHELFEEQALKTPDSLVLLYKDQKLTYAEFNSRANQWGHYLRKRGVGPEVPVGIFLERSLDAAITLLGILKAGGAYVAINPAYPLSRIEEIINHAKLSVAITNSQFRNRLPLGNLEIIDLDRTSSEIRTESSMNISSGVAADNAAYITFTSGSTGKQKGVIGIHRSITNGLTHAYFERDREDEISCLLAPLSFAASVAPLLLPPCWGIPVVIIPEGHEKDPQSLAKTIEERKITSIIMSASLFRQLLSLGPQTAVRLSSVRTLALTGSTVTPDLIDAFKRNLPDARLLIAYAASEIGGAATTKIMTAQAASEQVLIGQVVPNTRIYILDRAMNPVPLGVVGELHVAAAHLARGYLGQPDTSAERFLPNPFSVSQGERLYRTGDLARYHPNGGIELLGRSDNQAKIHGFRVELGEVEAALAGYPEVQESAVVAHEFEKEQRLVAYLAMHAGVKASVTELRRYLQQRLPEYMIPSVFVFLKNLPLTANGKLDRNALLPPDASRPELDIQYEGPRNPVEEAVSDIWKSLLGLEQIGINDDFLDLGGDSLVAAQTVSRIRSQFGVEIPLITFFEFLTIAELAVEISRARDAEEGKRDPGEGSTMKNALE